MPLEPKTTPERIITEIFTTEETYLASLEQFIAATDDQAVFGQNDIIQKQRAEIKSMIFLSKELLSLTNGMTVIPTEAQVAEFFNKNGQFLKVYEPYAISYSEYDKERLKNKKALDTAINNNLEGKTSLIAADIAITPIQRIPRYRLLLEELLKKTPNDTPEHANISKALETVKVRATAINEIKRTDEQQAKAQTFLKKTPNKLIQKAIENKTGAEIAVILKYGQQLNNLKKNRKFYKKNSKDYDKLIKQVENVITHSFTGEKQDRIEPNHDVILQKLENASKPKAATATLTETTDIITSQIAIEASQAVVFHEANPAQEEQAPVVTFHEAKPEAKKVPVFISDETAAALALLKEPPPIMPSGSVRFHGATSKPDSKAGADSKVGAQEPAASETKKNRP